MKYCHQKDVTGEECKDQCAECIEFCESFEDSPHVINLLSPWILVPVLLVVVVFASYYLYRFVYWHTVSEVLAANVSVIFFWSALVAGVYLIIRVQ